MSEREFLVIAAFRIPEEPDDEGKLDEDGAERFVNDRISGLLVEYREGVAAFPLGDEPSLQDQYRAGLEEINMKPCPGCGDAIPRKAARCAACDETKG